MSVIGRMFPEIKGHSLAGSEVAIPGAAAGRIALISVAFERHAQEMLDSWSEPFVRKFGGNETYVTYELPVIDAFWPRLMSFSIDAGMRSGIPREKHPYVVTYYGDSTAFRQALEISDRSLGYVYLLDHQGVIRWAGSGYANDERIREMIGIAGELGRKAEAARAPAHGGG